MQLTVQEKRLQTEVSGLETNGTFRKGYLKIHIAVDVKTKKILSFKVTDEHTHDSKALPGLIKGVIKSDSMTPTAAATTIGKLFADGACR